MTPQRDLHLDFETYCDLDLKKVGIHNYVNHPSFRVLCAAWKLVGQPTRRVMPGRPYDLLALMKQPDVQGHAFNAAFETAVLLAAWGVVPANPISCTMQRALAYGLPGRLEAAGAALGAPVQKDAAGHRLMMRLSRPGKDGQPPVMTSQDLGDLCTYCAQDVDSEEAVSDVIPRLSATEWQLSKLDAAMNRDGVMVNRGRVSVLRAAALRAEKADAARCAALTAGAVTSPGTQTARLLAWLHAQGLSIPDVARNSIEDALVDGSLIGLSTAVDEVLEIRLRTARGSVKKLDRMIHMSDTAGRLCYQFQFCGAGRTGRWSGRGIQPQNLPRVPKGFSPDSFHKLAVTAEALADPVGLDAIAPAAVLDCISWSLRSCLQAFDGQVMWGFDFSQIEARVLAWLAGQHDVLDVFRRGEDVYTWAAGQFGSTDRQLGKVLILALGFGMGASKLRETARKNYGVALTSAQAESFKTSWRQRNHHIVQFWIDIAYAATQAIIYRGKTVAVGGSGIVFHCTQRTLQMRLPSGRLLYYHRPRIDSDGSITYWGVELNQWTEVRTYGGKLAENATQAVARDVMSEAMLRLWERVKRVPLMTVHDELVYGLTLLDIQHGVGKTLEGLMLEAPPWAGGLPIAGEAKVMHRYSLPIATAA